MTDDLTMLSESLPPVVRARLAGWLACAERGWHLFPIRPGHKAPPVFEDWRRHATTDAGKLARWFADHPRHNAGIACGPSGLLVVDCDLPKHRGESGSGAANLAELATQHRAELPATYTVATPSGGRHLYFRAPDPTGGQALGNSNRSVAGLLDTRGDGGYVLAPGCWLAPRPATATKPGHPGGVYELVDDTEPAELPTWLHQELTADRSTAISAPPERASTAPRWPERYLAAVLRAELQRIHSAEPGQHNTSVFTAARALGQLSAGGALDHDRAETLLTRAAHTIAAGPCDCTMRALLATIRSGLAYGARRPRHLPTNAESAAPASSEGRRSA